MEKNSRESVQNQEQEKRRENTKAENESPKISITDAVVLAVLTAFSYIFHYFFEYGYLSYFDVPPAFISFNLTELIPAVFFLVVTYLIFILLLWPFINLLITILPGFIKNVLVFIPWLIMSVFLGFSWEIILLIFLCIFLILVANSSKAKRMWKGKNQNHTQLQNKNDSLHPEESNTSFDPGVTRFILSGNRLLLIYFLLTAIIGSMAFGRIAAMTRTSFLVSETYPSCAVVYTTADRYVCKPFDQANLFEHTFKIYYF